jgi:hypothetical protein
MAVGLVAPSFCLAEKINVPPQTTVIPIPADRAARPIGFAKISSKMAKGQVWGHAQAGVFCGPYQSLTWGEGRFRVDMDAFKSVFETELEKAGFSVVGRRDGLFDLDDRAKADFLVGGMLREPKAKICAKLASFGNFDALKGQITLDMEWQIYSTMERRVVARVESRGGIDRSKFAPGDTTLLINQAFSEHVRQLINSPTFREIVLIKRTND